MALFGDWERAKASLTFAATGKAEGVVKEEIKELVADIHKRLKENILERSLSLRPLAASTVARKGSDHPLLDMGEYVQNIEVTTTAELLHLTFTIGPSNKKARNGESFQSLAAKLEGGTVKMQPLPHFAPTFLQVKDTAAYKSLARLKRLRTKLPR